MAVRERQVDLVSAVNIACRSPNGGGGANLAAPLACLPEASRAPSRGGEGFWRSRPISL